MGELKYKFLHGEPARPKYTEGEAIKQMEEFINTVRAMMSADKEKSFHLFLNNNHWNIVADSAHEYKIGEHIKEIIV